MVAMKWRRDEPGAGQVLWKIRLDCERHAGAPIRKSVFNATEGKSLCRCDNLLAHCHSDSLYGLETILPQDQEL